MRRGPKPDFFGSIRAQAAKVLRQLEGQIQSLEAELSELRGQVQQWRQLAGGSSSGGRATATRGAVGRPAGATRARAGGKRVKWDEVLSFLPKRFGVQDVMKHPGAAAKGRAQVYPALNRWESTQRVRRVGKGLYEKAGNDVAGANGTSTPNAKRAPGRKRGRPAKRGKAAAPKAPEAKSS
jgi:hypothetical protein